MLQGENLQGFGPLNTAHKSLLEVVGEPIIVKTINNLPVDEVVIVEGPDKKISSTLKNFHINKHIEFRVQDKPRGMWEAILLGAEDYGGDVIVLSGHRFSPLVFEKLKDKSDLTLVVSKVSNPKEYGVVKLLGDKAVGVVEKSKNPPSDLVLNSIYFLTSKFIRHLQSYRKKEHYLFERALNDFLKENPAQLEIIPKEEVPSLKYPWNALSVMERLLDDVPSKILGDVSEDALILGDVFVDEGAKVMEGAIIKGPAYIGKGAIIGTGSLIRQSSIESGAVIGFGCEIAKSLIGPGVKIHHGFIGDSVVGRDSWLGFGCTTANRRFDKKEVKCKIGRKLKPTGRGHFGCVIGENTKIGVNVSIMPGVLIGNCATIGPNTIVDKLIKDKKKVYVVQKKVVK